jgi:hypothetical protein
MANLEVNMTLHGPDNLILSAFVFHFTFFVKGDGSCLVSREKEDATWGYGLARLDLGLNSNSIPRFLLYYTVASGKTYAESRKPLSYCSSTFWATTFAKSTVLIGFLIITAFSAFNSGIAAFKASF